MKIVIDTNVLASGIFFDGKPGELLRKVVARELETCVSAEIVREYRETVEELCSRYPTRPPQLPLTQILSAMELVAPRSRIHVCRDPDDDKFIECALDAECVYIVSGDKDLLSVEQYQGIRIVTVAQFLADWQKSGTSAGKRTT